VGGHAVRMLGFGVDYSVDPNGVKYWLLANSWNSAWGENGFFRFLRGSNHCGIEEHGVTGVPKIY
jgi:cathepsin B